MFMTIAQLFLALGNGLCAHAVAPGDAFLDPPYRDLKHPRVSILQLADGTTKNDVLALISKQSPVKNQGARGACTIFSSTALLEGMLLREGKAEPSVDLSEEWLQYLIAQNTTIDGSSTPWNFVALHRYGIASESKMPYVALTWRSLDTSPEADKRCGPVHGLAFAHCLTGHRDAALLNLSDDLLTIRDPEFLAARREAQENRQRFFTGQGEENSGIVLTTEALKKLLNDGIPASLDIDFYYGAWNHRLAPELGLDRNMDAWTRGIVGYPETDSLDFANSPKQPAGHSVLIVGYDDEKEISYEAKMKDGSVKTFKRKGVYYFKNSWGSESFGSQTEIEGRVLPGYGMITQDYANEHGQFFHLSL